MENYFEMNFTPRQLAEMPALGLAHMGDGVFELLCRGYLWKKGGRKVLNLHRDTVKLVNAASQAAFADKLQPVLTQEEQGYYRRGKNAHTHAAPKSASPQEYAKATGLEALFGALYLLGQKERINELFCLCVGDDNR